MTFAGQTAVVTGSASGIGKATEALLRQAGATVIGLDRTPQPNDSPAVDLAHPGQIEAVGRAITQRHEQIDILVNCAGIVPVGGTAECSLADWDLGFAVNVRASWLLARALLPAMRERSSIVNVSSGAGLRAIPEMVGYVASKHAVVGLTRAMAMDLAPQGIRVNCVCPGQVDTPLAAQVQTLRSPQVRNEVSAFDAYLIKRAATPQEVAKSICFLASEESAYTTGVCLAVDGGRSMH